MSIEGFLSQRKRFRTRHNMYQLVADEEHFDLDVAIKLLNAVGESVENRKEIWTLVPPGYKWELIK